MEIYLTKIPVTIQNGICQGDQSPENIQYLLVFAYGNSERLPEKPIKVDTCLGGMYWVTG